MRTAVVITTYNRPEALAAVLDGYLAQDDTHFELIVADDGSGDETRRLVADYARRAPFRLEHIWQEDRGFRAAAIRNRALLATQAEYIVFSDGDCIPRSSFVSRHQTLAERRYFLAGNRVLLSRGFTQSVLQERTPIHRWSAARWAGARVRGDINRALPLVALPDAPFRRLAPARWEGVKTCNLSAWRDDLVRINGFDETYSGWGLEDSDLVIRLIHAGVRHKSARFATPVFHLWHPENDRSRLPDNQRRLDELLASQRTRAGIGLDRCQ